MITDGWEDVMDGQAVGTLAMMALIRLARKAAQADDLPAMRRTAGEMLRQLRGGTAASSLLRADEAELDRLYDVAFPLTDPTDAADVLDAPWPTVTRQQALQRLLGEETSYEARLDPLVGPAADAGDVRLLRVIAFTPLGRIRDGSRALLLDALQAADALDDELVTHTTGFANLTRDLVGYGQPIVAAATGERFRPFWDDRLWQLISVRDVDWDRVPMAPTPRGLRFVLRGLDGTGNWRMDRHLGAAGLTPAERAELVGLLGREPVQRQERALTLRLAAGDARALLPLLGMAGAERLLDLIQHGQAVGRLVRNDRAAILAAAAEAGDANARRLLKLVPNDVVAAALGLRRGPVMTRVGKDSPTGIAAYGMLPPTDGESVLDRWAALRELHRRGMAFGAPDRRRQHASAIDVALEHLAQVGGYADAAALDAAGEAYSPTPVLPPLVVGAYTAAVGFDGAEPAIVATKNTRVLKTVPKAVREDPGYEALQGEHELLRGHTARLRGRLRGLIASGAPLPPAELARLRATGPGAALLPRLVWQDAGGRFGLLDEVDVAGPVAVAHPAALAAAGLLGRWQAEAVRQRLRQPVPQLFREWYAPTPPEAAGQSTRFTGRVIGGGAAARHLATRGWSLHDGARPYASKAFGGGTAVLHAATSGYWAAGDLGFLRLEFRDGDTAVPADRVPPRLFSEAMRELDLAAWAGRRSVGDYAQGRARARGDLLDAVLGGRADRITRHGDTVVVAGSRAVYRVHLGTDTVMIGDSGLPSDVSYLFGDAPHPALYDTVDGGDRPTTHLLTRILLLADDERITDPWTLTQLGLPSGPPQPCARCGQVHSR
ncbi:DUF4132 domain-containing protein [Catellatospora sp. KI3]|uniref:DUF4132 domain-containing protein n=1 Tax=Catellatospora sp. KI3 TaxID=3041620 RepID=UPI002482E2CC|nr:DUF4132 domain-containing protein [Catellatospora sp. KI3]MDI1460650.1 DUF4132 domain-containing protein [Catellatospora sp. KI3]